MTIDELKAIPFHFVCSAAWEDEHTLTYESERLKHKQQQYVNKFIIVTVVGWLLAIVMCIAIFMR
jgi:hypothetical protein